MNHHFTVRIMVLLTCMAVGCASPSVPTEPESPGLNMTSAPRSGGKSMIAADGNDGGTGRPDSANEDDSDPPIGGLSSQRTDGASGAMIHSVDSATARAAGADSRRGTLNDQQSPPRAGTVAMEDAGGEASTDPANTMGGVDSTEGTAGHALSMSGEHSANDTGHSPSAGHAATGSPCEDRSDGTLVQAGVFGPCTYASPCVQNGTKRRTDRVCGHGLVMETIVIEACVRDTNGVVLNEGTFDACVYADDCTNDGSQRRIDRVCDNGAAIDRPVQQPCTRNTDGVVISQGTFDACIFADDCTNDGSQRRIDRVCDNGAA
ncbi:MAG: hypothetical protein VX589_17990, partial [Myxococcota bacterium]|nr:hypothetical protein [Myxococcota bacterium]